MNMKYSRFSPVVSPILFLLSSFLFTSLCQAQTCVPITVNSLTNCYGNTGSIDQNFAQAGVKAAVIPGQTYTLSVDTTNLNNAVYFGYGHDINNVGVSFMGTKVRVYGFSQPSASDAALIGTVGAGSANEMWTNFASGCGLNCFQAVPLSFFGNYIFTTTAAAINYLIANPASNLLTFTATTSNISIVIDDLLTCCCGDNGGDGHVSEALNLCTTSGLPTPTPTPTNTGTLPPTNTATNTLTQTPTLTPTYSPTLSPTNTGTLPSTNTATSTPTQTPTLTPNNSPTLSPTNTNTISPTHSPTVTPTFTPTSTPTITNTPTITFTPTNSPTVTPTVTYTPVPVDVFYADKNMFSPTSDKAVSITVAYNQYPGEYSLRIYNTAGEHIKTLDAKRLNAPVNQTYTWDGTNKNGDACASGVYIFYLIEPFNRKIKRILLVR